MDPLEGTSYTSRLVPPAHGMGLRQVLHPQARLRPWHPPRHRSQIPQQQQDQKDDQNGSQHSPRSVPPGSAVRPGGQSAYQQQDQYYQQDGACGHMYLAFLSDGASAPPSTAHPAPWNGSSRRQFVQRPRTVARNVPRRRPAAGAPQTHLSFFRTSIRGGGPIVRPTFNSYSQATIASG